jgi:hypothetical protein
MIRAAGRHIFPRKICLSILLGDRIHNSILLIRIRSDPHDRSLQDFTSNPLRCCLTIWSNFGCKSAVLHFLYK